MDPIDSATLDIIGMLGLSPLMAAILTFLVKYVFDSFVQSLPDPQQGERFYLFIYRFAHALAANHGVVRRPPDPRGKVVKQKYILVDPEKLPNFDTGLDAAEQMQLTNLLDKAK